MTITISASGISLDGPLVAGEKVAVTVSGLSFAAEDKPTLALLARFPDALLASVELTESDTPGTWTGELDTATKQTALFFATARADERRDAALELVAGRVSIARLTVPMANSALCPNPDGSPFASPVYVPVPGPQGDAATITVGETTTLPAGSPATVENGGTSSAAVFNFGIPEGVQGEAATIAVGTTQTLQPGSDATVTNVGTSAAAVFNFGIPKGEKGDPQTPSDATPQMDGTGAAGSETTYARGDHVHPSDTSKVNKSGDTMTGQLALGSNGLYQRSTDIPPLDQWLYAGRIFINTDGDTSHTPEYELVFPLKSGVFAMMGDLRYSLASLTPSVSGTAATVACEDRAINDFTVATGITSLTITPPAAVTGRARDFFCRVTLTDSSLPTVTLSGATIDIGATEVAGMTQGVNLLMFTEISSGHWLASRRSAS